MDHVLISSMKDEGPFVLEWVAHHLALGFDRVIVATNDCTDGTDRLLGALDRAGFAGHVPHVPPEGEPPQHAGYAAIRRRHPIDAARWLMVLDADEFLNVHLGAHRVQDLTGRAEAEGVDIVALHAMTFAGDEGPWAPGPVTGRFQGRLALRHKANSLLKTLARDPSRFKAIHNHSMVGFRERRAPRVLWGDGSVRDLDPAVPLWRALRSAPAGEGAHRLGQVNHYATKSRDAYWLRRARGRGAVAATDLTERHTDLYWAERAGARGVEASIDRYRDEVGALMARMRAEPAVAEAQAAVEAEWAERTRRARQAMGWRQEAE